MIIKYCPKCSGRPYTEDFLMTNCPCCNTMLSSELVNSEQDLAGRTRIGAGAAVSFDIGNDAGFSVPIQENVFGEKSAAAYPSFGTVVEAPDLSGILDTEKKEKKQRKKRTPAPASEKVSKLFEASAEEPVSVALQGLPTTIRGKVTQYSSTGKEDGEYRRLFPLKIYQAIAYRQRLEDVLHRFTVKVEQKEDVLGYQDYVGIPVNVHGTISGGMQLVDNAEVEVHGKYANGVLMADSIYIISNGYKSKVGFQHSARAITNGILIVAMLALLCYVGAISDLGFFEAVKKFSGVWLIFSVISVVVYAMSSLSKYGMLTRMFSNKKKSFPIVPILLASEVLAFLFVVVFGSFTGLGSFVLSGIYALIGPAIIIIALFWLIKKVIFG